MRPLALAVLLALLAPAARAEASGVHLALAPDGYVVAFGSAAPLAHPVVRVETPGGARDVDATLAQRPEGDPGWAYFATIPRDATAYTVEGRRFEVHAMPSDHLRVAFVADMGVGEEAWAVWKQVEQAKPDLVVVGGDLSYANGRPETWDEWLAHVEPLAARVPLMTARGNHETYCSPDGVQLQPCARESAEYLARFHMPAPGLYYAFEAGGVQFVALDTEAYHPDPAMGHGTDAAQQRDWLRQQLDRPSLGWRIVYFHRPLFSSNAHGGDSEDAQARADLLPVLSAGKVDLVLSGHAHAYERSWPMKDERVAAQADTVRKGNGTLFVTSGGGGRSLYSEWNPAPAWSARRSAEYELLLLDIGPTEIRAQALRPDGSVLDSFAVQRPSAPATTPPSTGGTLPAESSRPVDALAAPLVLLVLALAAMRRRPGR